MYPLNMTKPSNDSRIPMGFAVANDETEHAALSQQGYEPKYVAPQPEAEIDADASEGDGEGHTVASARAKLDELGIAYDKRMGLKKLLELMPEGA